MFCIMNIQLMKNENIFIKYKVHKLNQHAICAFVTRVIMISIYSI